MILYFITDFEIEGVLKPKELLIRNKLKLCKTKFLNIQFEVIILLTVRTVQFVLTFKTKDHNSLIIEPAHEKRVLYHIVNQQASRYVEGTLRKFPAKKHA